MSARRELTVYVEDSESTFFFQLKTGSLQLNMYSSGNLVVTLTFYSAKFSFLSNKTKATNKTYEPVK